MPRKNDGEYDAHELTRADRAELAALVDKQLVSLVSMSTRAGAEPRELLDGLGDMVQKAGRAEAGDGDIELLKQIQNKIADTLKKVERSVSFMNLTMQEVVEKSQDAVRFGMKNAINELEGNINGVENGDGKRKRSSTSDDCMEEMKEELEILKIRLIKFNTVYTQKDDE